MKTDVRMKNPDRLRLFVWNFSPAQRTASRAHARSSVARRLLSPSSARIIPYPRSP